MLEHMKKHRIELKITGPAENKSNLEKMLKKFGFVIQADDSVAWRTAFKEFEHNTSGTALAGARHKEGLTQVKLSGLTGIPQRHISEMERGKRPVGKKNAKLFADVLKINHRVLL